MSDRVIKRVIAYDSSMGDARRCDVVISEGAIKALEPSGTARGDVIFDGEDRCVVAPGLVNAHGHPAMTMLRGLGEELPLMEWLTQKIFPIEDKLTAEDVRIGSDVAMMEMISSGTTCFSDMYFFEDQIADSALDCGIRGVVSRSVVDDDGHRLAESVELVKNYSDRSPLLKVFHSAHAPYTISRENLRRVVDASLDQGVGLQIHWLETEGELESFMNDYKITPTDYLKETGLLDVIKLVLAHSVWHPAEGFDVLARDNVSIVHNPASNMKLGSGYAPVVEMIDAGINAALGTDGASSNNRLDMWSEMHIAALIHKGHRRDAMALSARQAFAMATINGARAFGFDDVGLIAPGQRADLIVVDTDKPEYVGMDLSNVPEYIVYSGSSADVEMTIVDGKVLYDRGTFSTIDAERTLAVAREKRTKLVSS